MLRLLIAGCLGLGLSFQATALEWDDIEDAAEAVGSKIEEGWETVEDAVIPETEEERREEAQERAEEAAEEAAEERCKKQKEGFFRAAGC